MKIKRNSFLALSSLLTLVFIFSSIQSSEAKGKNCDRICESNNAKIAQQIFESKLTSDPTTLRKVLIAFATPVNSKKADSVSKAFIAKINQTPDACLLTAGASAIEIVRANQASSNAFRNTFSSIIASLVTSPLDFMSGQVAGALVEKALNKTLNGKNFAIAQAIQFAAYKNQILGDLAFCS